MERSRILSRCGLVGVAAIVGLVACSAPSSESSDLGVARQALVVEGWTMTSGSGSVTKHAAGRLVLANAGTTSAKVEKGLSLATNFTVAFRQRVRTFGTEQGMVAYANGVRVQLYFKAGAIEARNASGGKDIFSFDVGTSFHDYEVVVQAQRGTLFADGRMLGSFALEAAPGESERVAHWVKGPVQTELELDGTNVWSGEGFAEARDWKTGTSGWSVVGSGLSQLAESVRLQPPAGTELGLEKPISPSSEYRVHFRAQVLSHGKENGFALYDGQYRAMFYIESNGLRVRQDDGTTIRLVHWDTATSLAWHDYEVVTRNGRGHLYVDGKYGGEWRLQADAGSAKLKHWSESNGAVSSMLLSTTYLRNSLAQPHVFDFDFETETPGLQPSFWWETNTTDTWEGNVWKVKTQDGGNVYRRMDQGIDGSLSLLHYFAKNATFTGRFRINYLSATSGAEPKLYIQSRRNMEEARVTAAYDFTSGGWSLIERKDRSVSSVTRDTHSQGLAVGQWHTFALNVQDASATFSVDGQTVLTTNALTHLNFGRIGIQAKEADVSWDDLRIEVDEPENGRLMNGVEEFTFRSTESASRTTVFGLPGELVAVGGNAVYSLPQGGQSWVLDSQRTGLNTNMLPLPEGLLRFGLAGGYANGTGGTTACPTGQKVPVVDVSTDGGRTFGPLTEIAGCMTGKSMPDKVYVDSANRVFLGHGYSPTGEDHAGNAARSRIFRRSPEGVWQATTTVGGGQIFDGFLTPSGAPLSPTEAEVVETEPNQHKAFFRTNAGYLYESLSSDGGLTWGAPRPTIFRSTRTSFNVDRDVTTGYHYMVWEYDDNALAGAADDHLPRTRVALAVSRDGTRSWEFVGDLDDFKGTARHMNTGLKIIGDSIWVGLARYDGDTYVTGEGETESFFYSRLWKIDKRLIEATPRFPGTH